ncbi:uncharacterized protein LOC143904835 [Temnothorax americanus]|uniref:uncharacterized protein LOC143904835 n=1 Tax=Temnothorax americanus TaxID=1964332 RepID=UPI004068C73E
MTDKGSNIGGESDSGRTSTTSCSSLSSLSSRTSSSRIELHINPPRPITMTDDEFLSLDGREMEIHARSDTVWRNVLLNLDPAPMYQNEEEDEDTDDTLSVSSSLQLDVNNLILWPHERLSNCPNEEEEEEEEEDGDVPEPPSKRRRPE